MKQKLQVVQDKISLIIENFNTFLSIQDKPSAKQITID